MGNKHFLTINWHRLLQKDKTAPEPGKWTAQTKLNYWPQLFKGRIILSGG